MPVWEPPIAYCRDGRPGGGGGTASPFRSGANSPLPMADEEDDGHESFKEEVLKLLLARPLLSPSKSQQAGARFQLRFPPMGEKEWSTQSLLAVDRPGVGVSGTKGESGWKMADYVKRHHNK